MIRNAECTFTSKPLRNVRCVLLLIPRDAMALAGIALAIAAGGGVQLQAQQCDPVIVLTEFFDSVTPPALPPSWSSTTWVTSDSGVPSPPADTLPNAAFVDDPATINDKQLLSPTLPIRGGSMRVYFRNNFISRTVLTAAC
jgi:hypothetical protein